MQDSRGRKLVARRRRTRNHGESRGDCLNGKLDGAVGLHVLQEGEALPVVPAVDHDFVLRIRKFDEDPIAHVHVHEVHDDVHLRTFSRLAADAVKPAAAKTRSVGHECRCMTLSRGWNRAPILPAGSTGNLSLKPFDHISLLIELDLLLFDRFDEERD